MEFHFSVEKIPFVKMTGSGNDFILVDNRCTIIKPEEAPEFAKQVCRRKLSTGADGLILIEDDKEVDFSWRFFNSDGSEAEMCGNGSRCAARFAFLKGIVKVKSMTFRTKAGFIRAELNDEKRVKVQIPGVRDLKLNIELSCEDKGSLTLHYVNTGVPHAVVLLPDFETLENHPVVPVGRLIRYHKYFQPRGTNVNFAWVKNHDEIFVRTYERGVEDETLACGTGSIAAAVVSSALGLTEPPVLVQTRGGETLRVFFDKTDGGFSNVFLEGQALVVYEGSLWSETITDK